MATNIFVSFDHVDAQQVNGFKLLKNNPKYPLDFRDHSLREPVKDRSGRPITYPPSDPCSKPVRDEIEDKFANASKLIVLIGSNTAGSEWVSWEVKTFFDLKKKLSGDKTWKRLRGMKLKGHENAEIPSILFDRSTKVMDWDPEELDQWIGLDPDS